MRYAMRDAGLTQFTEDLLEHGYKEMTFPPGPAGEYCMEKVGEMEVASVLCSMYSCVCGCITYVHSFSIIM